MKSNLNVETSRRHSSTSLPPLRTTRTAATHSLATRFRPRIGRAPLALLALLALALTVPVRAAGPFPQPPPIPITLDATGVGEFVATLNGTFDTNGGPVRLAWFAWSGGANIFTSSGGVVSVEVGSAGAPLSPGTTYSFCLVAANESWIGALGGVKTFTTLPASLQPQFIFTTNNGTITITGCYGPAAVTIPSTITGLPVTSIGDRAFAEYFSLASVTIPDSVTNIGSGAFWSCSSLTNLTIGNNVVSIADLAFAECTSLTSVTIPDRVTSIGTNAFSDCTSLTHVTIGNSVTTIGNEAFGGCTSLTSVTLPNSVKNIGDDAFYGCRGLTSITLPNSVATIGDLAFYDCTSLTNVAIGSGLAYIGQEAFVWCTRLTAITVDARNSVYSSADGVLFDKSQTTLVEYPGGRAGNYTITNTVTNIGQEAFVWCTGLTSVTIPNTVTGIGDDAFNWCTSLTNATLGNGVTSIGDEAFSYCSSLTSITLPNSVTHIGDGSFAWCSSLTTITLPNSVTHIADGTFRGCTSLISVAIPDSVTGIGEWAFDDCSSLTHVTIGNGVTSIDYSAFSSCTKLTSVTIPNSVTEIGYEAFQGCTSLTNVTIGSGVTNIDNWGFAGCTSLTALYFGGNAPSLGWAVFDGDNNATIYYLPTAIGWAAAFGGRPTAPWPPPNLLMSPQTQTAEAGSAVRLGVKASSPLPLFYLWYLNSTNLLSSGSNCQLDLPNVRLDQSGVYTVVISNVLGAVTSSPAMLQVIAPVERRPVPGVKLTGATASLVNVDCTGSLTPAPNWTPLGSVSLTGTPQYCFDFTLPLPPERFYRAWQTGTPGVRPSLDLHLVPAITLTGTVGHSVRLDYINQFGPTDAWVTLATLPLTNTSQLYFDTSAPGQPQRLYRLVPSP